MLSMCFRWTLLEMSGWKMHVRYAYIPLTAWYRRVDSKARDPFYRFQRLSEPQPLFKRWVYGLKFRKNPLKMEFSTPSQACLTLAGEWDPLSLILQATIPREESSTVRRFFTTAS